MRAGFDCLAFTAPLGLFRIVEVMIERKCYFNTKLFHHDFACAIGEAPILIVELLKDLPRKRQIGGGDLVYFH
jgi:hypothetical protein